MEHLNPALIKKIADRNRKKDKFDFGLGNFPFPEKKESKKRESIFDALIKPMDSTEGRK